MRWLVASLMMVACTPTQHNRPTVPIVERSTPAPSEAPTPAVACIDGHLGRASSLAKITGVVRDVSGPRPDLAAEQLCAGLPSLFPCRREALKKGNVAGTLAVTLAFDEQGAVTSAKRSSGSLGDSEMSRCVEQALSRVKLPLPQEAKGTLTYELRFRDPEPVVAMIEAGTDIRGRLPPEIIKKVVRARFPGLRACYESALKSDPDVVGLARLRFVIDETGKVTVPTVSITGTLDQASVHACLLDVIKGLEFPEPEVSKVLVVYPIYFHNGG